MTVKMERRILFIFILIFLRSITQANDFLVLSSSPSGRYLIIQNKAQETLIYDIQVKDTISRFFDNSKFTDLYNGGTFLGWKDDTSLFYIQGGCINVFNVLTNDKKVIQKVDNKALQIIRKSTFSVPSYYTDSLLFLVYADTSGIVYRYDLATSSKRQILNLTDFFGPKHTINYLSIAPNGDLLFNIQYENKSGIFFYPLNGNGRVVHIDTTSKITPESYCFFFNIEKKCIYYRYHKRGDNLSGIEVVEYDLSKMEQIFHEYLPRGIVPSLAVDIPAKKIFLINSIVVESNYTLSLGQTVFNGNSEIKEILFEMVGEYIEKLMNSFQVIPYNYNTYSIQINFVPNSDKVSNKTSADKTINEFLLTLDGANYNKIIIIPNADYNEASFKANQKQAITLMKNRGKVIKEMLINAGISEDKIEIELGNPIKGTNNIILKVW